VQPATPPVEGAPPAAAPPVELPPVAAVPPVPDESTGSGEHATVKAATKEKAATRCGFMEKLQVKRNGVDKQPHRRAPSELRLGRGHGSRSPVPNQGTEHA
jgi:hypothetical protein